MAITKCKLLRKHSRSAGKDARKGTREYKLWYGTIDEAEAYISANAPSTMTTWDSVVMDIESLDIDADEVDERVHHAILQYSSAPRRERSDIGTETVSFDLSGQVVKQYQSLQTVAKYAASGTAPEFQGGIGFVKDRFEGADVYVPTFSFTVTKILANASITNAYTSSLETTAFRWNSTIYRGRPIGSCLFVGATGSPRDEKSYTVSYKFLCQSNATGLTVGGISGITKQGWDYLWVLRQELEDTTAKFITPRPLAAYVERLYTSANFSTNLGLNAA